MQRTWGNRGQDQCWDAGEESDEFESLRFAAGERGGWRAEYEVAEADFVQVPRLATAKALGQIN